MAATTAVNTPVENLLIVIPLVAPLRPVDAKWNGAMPASQGFTVCTQCWVFGHATANPARTVTGSGRNSSPGCQ
jgi:hypothetical protein